MSWIELDDGILDHPKFIRAVRLGGEGIIFLWLGLRAYCAKNLTDGIIPEDMLDEVRGPRGKARERMLQVLVEVGLLEREGESGPVVMHDYLDWSSSRDEVLDRREKARERKAKSRSPSQRDSARSSSVVTNPSSSSISPTPPVEEEENAREQVSCPPDLSLTAEQRASLVTSLVPESAIDETTKTWRAKYAGDPEKRTLAQWRRGLVTACSRAANDRSAPRQPRAPNNLDAWLEGVRKKAGGEKS